MGSSIARRFASALMHLRAGNLRRATRTGRNRKTEAVQFDDRSDQAQAEAQALGAPAFVRTIEALGHRFAFDLGDARTGVAYPDDAFVPTAKQDEFHASALGGEFHR